jgi:hypothetical protein
MNRVMLLFCYGVYLSFSFRLCHMLRNVHIKILVYTFLFPCTESWVTISCVVFVR